MQNLAENLVTLVSGGLILVIFGVVIYFSLKSSLKIFSIKFKMYSKVLGIALVVLVIGVIVTMITGSLAR